MNASPQKPTISRRFYTPERLEHRHDYHQIVLHERGCLEMTVGGTAGTVSAARLVVIEPDQDHVCWAPRLTQCVVVDLPPKPHDLPLQTAPSFRPIDARISTITAAMGQELSRAQYVDPLITEALAAYLVAALANQSPADSTRGTSVSQTRVAVKTREYIDANMAEALTLDGIADAVGASVSHVQHAFRAHFGVSVVSFIHDARLRQASDLLRSTDLSITEIAGRVGFTDSGYFTRLFRRAFGSTPSTFRRQL